ncbi:MAG: M48 family metalloprotease [Thermoleophilaceae bacterium]
MRKVGYTLPVAAVAAVVAAAAATLLMRPRGGLIEPAAVEATAYFSRAQLERAEEFRDPQRLLALAGLGVSGVTLTLLALRGPRERLSRLRPVRGAAAAAGAVSLVLVVVNLPLDAIRHDRAVDVGLSTQDWGPWLWDVAKAAGIGAVFAAGGGAIAVALWRRFKGRWWIPASAAVVAVGAAFLYASPLVIEPLFNRFEELPEGKLRSEVLELSVRAGVDVGEVYRVDASRRTTGANAYVAGLGHTKRVVLYDNLIEDFTPAEVRSVVAHELGHVKHDDVPRGLLFLALIAPPGMLLVQRMVQLLAPGARGADLVPALALSVAVVGLAGQIAGNYVSRGVEARADAFALRLTNDPDAFISLERRLTVQNISEPDPPELRQTLFGTHPTTLERIGYGEAYRR